MSVEGDSVDFSHVTQDEREALYNEVWTDPVTTVAKRYNMSDNGLRKHCKRLWIPLPPNGYWAKLKAGQKVTKPILSKVTGDLKKYVRNYVIKYVENLETLTESELTIDIDFSLLKEETREFIKKKCSLTQVKGQLRNPSPEITKHKEEVIYRKKRDKALKQASFNTNYYANIKSKYRENEAMLPLYVSDSNMNRAYRIIDTLIDTLEDMEGYIRVLLDSGKDAAYFGIMRSVFYFELKEYKRKKSVSLDDTEELPHMVLLMLGKSWFGDSVQFRMEYKENDTERLETQVGKIIYDMFVAANKIRVADELDERESKRNREEHERERRLEQMRKGELEELKLLEQAASDWGKAQKIREFAADMELKINVLVEDKKREKLIRWLKWARDKAEWIDPLLDKEDQLLGKSRYIFKEIGNMDC